MAKRIILHVGLPKTGTSALQYFLKKNFEMIVKNGKESWGYYVPKYRYAPWDGLSNADFFVSLALQRLEQKNSPFTNNHLVIKSDSFKPQVYEEERKALKSYSDRVDNLIFSDEFIWHWQSWYPDYWEEINEVVRDWLGDVEINILIYLRRQDLWALSKWKENVSAQIPSTISFKAELKVMEEYGFLNFDKELKKMEKVFGKDNIIPRVYDKKVWKNGSLLYDFLEAIDAPCIEDNITSYDNINLSISTDMAVAMRVMRKIPLIRKLHYLRFYRDSRKLETWKSKNANAFPLPLQKRIALLKYYEEGNNAIARRYGLGNSLFNNEIDTDREGRPSRLQQIRLFFRLLNVIGIQGLRDLKEKVKKEASHR